MESYWHPELRRVLNEIHAQYAEILEQLRKTGAQNDQILANQRKLYGALIGPPAAMHLAIKGDTMPLTVDSVNAVAILSFEDDHGDAVAPPAGALATVTSSDTAVLTVGASVAGDGRERYRQHPVPAHRGSRGHVLAVRRRDRRQRQPAAGPGRGYPDPGSRTSRRDRQPGGAGG